MTINKYPPLPTPAMCGPAGTGQYFDGFTAAQMQAYVDADRELRAETAAVAETVGVSEVIKLSEDIAQMAALTTAQASRGANVTSNVEQSKELKRKFIAAVTALAANAHPAEGVPAGWHTPGLGEVHNEDHTQMIYCADGDGVASDELARTVCAALLDATPAPAAVTSIAGRAQPEEEVHASTAVEIIRNLVDHIERNTCEHHETYRAGAIWEICSECGSKWADDKGGKPEFQWPNAVERAREFMLSSTPSEKSNSLESGGIKTASPVVLPEPDLYAINAAPPGYSAHWEQVAVEHSDAPSVVEFVSMPKVRALLAAGGQAQADARVALLTAIEDSGQGLRYELNCLVNNGINTFSVYDSQKEEFISGDWSTDPVEAIDRAAIAAAKGEQQ